MFISCPLFNLAVTNPGRRRRLNEGAFSLIEVTLALAIVAFAVIPLVGLMPVGLNVHRQSLSLTICAQIVQRVTTDLQQSNFTDIVGTGTTPVTFGPERYFDQEGNELLSPGPPVAPNPSAPNRVYDVVVKITSPTNLLGQQSYNLVAAQIQIANNPGHDPQIFTYTPAVYQTYFALVARR